MKYIIHLTKAILIKDIKYLTRYRLNSIFNILLLMFVFVGLSLGFDSVNKDVQLGLPIERIFSGYIIWLIMISNFMGMINNLMTETNVGTLEQLYINSRSFYMTLAIKGLSSMIITYFQILIIILLIIIFSPFITISFFFRFIIGIPVLIIGIPAIWGVSLFVCSFALQYKNVSSIYNALSSILFAVMSYSVHSSKMLASLSPFGIANISFQNILNGDSNSFSSDFYLIALNSMFYLMLGIFTFRYYEKKAKITGRFATH